MILLAFALMRLYATLTVSYASAHGVDYAGYMAGTERWLATGTPYVASEVAGPFEYGQNTFLHTPVSMLLFLRVYFEPQYIDENAPFTSPPCTRA